MLVVFHIYLYIIENKKYFGMIDDYASMHSHQSFQNIIHH